MGATTKSAKGEGVVAATSEEQIVPSLASMEGGTPTGADKSVGQSAPPPSTTTSEEQIIQADLTGDQPSTGKQNGGGETVEDIILSELGGSKEVNQPTTDDQKVGESLLVLIYRPNRGEKLESLRVLHQTKGGQKKLLVNRRHLLQQQLLDTHTTWCL